MTTCLRRSHLWVSALTVCLTLGSIGVASVQPASAQMGPRGGLEEGDGPRAERWEQRLNLTPEQRQKINSIRSQNRDQMRSLMTELRQARQRFSQLLSSNASDAEIRQQRQRVESLSQRLRDARFDSMLQVRSVLTPQQRQELAQMREQRRDRWGKRSGRGPGAGSSGPQGGDRPAQPIPVF